MLERDDCDGDQEDEPEEGGLFCFLHIISSSSPALSGGFGVKRKTA